MEEVKNQMNILNERYVPFILTSLLKNDEMRMNDFDKDITNLYTLKDVLNKLSEKGLINLRKESRPYRTTFISLTLKGQEVAKALKIAEEIATGERESAEVLEPMDYETSTELQNKVS